MAKCYLMVEDSPSGLAFAVDWGCKPEELPADVEELSEAQYTMHQFLTVLRGVDDPLALEAAKAEAKTKILVPHGGSDAAH